ncbi:hypothetical protein C8F01DRAFT_512266 [Mycena amicta]|nr:hypothetical protein C8F01DRAFT_512266 [Mycena amicta]
MESNESTSPSPTDSAEVKVPEKDEKYYFEDGDCTFLVERVLFKLHKFNLRRDPESMFCNMFKDANGEKSETISLDDSADDFRALCWVMYALPTETHLQFIQPANVPRLIQVAKKANKYSMTDFEQWAFEMLKAQCGSKSPPLNFAETCSEDMLESMMEVALICGATSFLPLVMAAWINRIAKGDFLASRALTLGEGHGLRGFSTDIYYNLIRRLTMAEDVSHDAISRFELTPDQLICLLSGHLRLSNAWNACRATAHWAGKATVFRGSGPGRLEGCSDHDRCQSDWQTVLFSKDPRHHRSDSDMVSCLDRARMIVRDPKGSLCIKQLLESFGLSKKAEIVEFILGPVKEAPAPSQ